MAVEYWRPFRSKKAVAVIEHYKNDRLEKIENLKASKGSMRHTYVWHEKRRR